MARSGPCNAGLHGVDIAEAIERADIGEKVCEEVSVIRREGAVRALDRATTAFDYANPDAEQAWIRFYQRPRLDSLTVSTYSQLRHPGLGRVAKTP
ncbi:hypothetical protein [Streptomyces lincolnensis]|uniref:hypothetical protein n=1 Tax=Streptomyces lincolnensis TaxID=1915 RepID=UPI0012601395|nr:hypothetical protein [Streptomyces lincolnensis]QMV07888.1 hypothetical protein GJU35_20925 [Streptomyces lincolnensis]